MLKSFVYDYHRFQNPDGHYGIKCNHAFIHSFIQWFHRYWFPFGCGHKNQFSNQKWQESVHRINGNTSGNNDNINNNKISDNCLILRENVATNVVFFLSSCFFCSSFSNKILWHGSETGRQTNDKVSKQQNQTGISVLRLDFNAALRVNKWINSMHHRLCSAQLGYNRRVGELKVITRTTDPFGLYQVNVMLDAFLLSCS